MPADLTREEIDAMQDRLAVDGDPTHDDMWALLDYARSEPTRLAQARAEGYREGVEAVAAALRREIPTGDGSTRSLTWSEALDAVDAIRAIPSAPPAEPAQPDGWIKRRGGDTQPVPDDTVVDLRVIDGQELLATSADGWRWRDIIAYRIVKPASAPVAEDE